MNRADNTFQVSEIISRYILGEISEREQEQLKQWLGESPRNRPLLEAMMQREMMAGKARAYERIGWQGALDELLRQKRAARRRRRLMRLARYAAMLVLPLAVGIYLVHVEKGDTGGIKAPEVEARVMIPAGESKATLQLASGEEVVLTSGSFQEIEQGNGVMIKQDSGMIKYKVDGTTMRRKEQFNTITVPRGGEFSLMLSDGTRVWLNAGSRLRYPVDFVGDQRRVYLEGEAFFDVNHDGKRFVVQTKAAEVKVYGTAFNITAYKDDRVTTATLVRGSIGMRDRKSNERIRLKPGEQARLADGELTKHEVDVEAYTAWLQGRLVFKSTRLEDMLRRLSRWYNVDIVFSEEELKEVTFTGEVEKYKDFNDILEVVESTQVVRFQIKGQTIIVLNNKK